MHCGWRSLPGWRCRTALSGPGRHALLRPRASLADKQLFTCLGEVSGSRTGDGQVHFRTRIPGAVRSVQFVRVVPLTEVGAEAAFAPCGLVPEAVWGTDGPLPWRWML